MAKVTHVVDWSTSKAIKIEAYPIVAHLGWNPYANFTVYPVNGVTVKVNVGTLTDKGTLSKLVSESVSISKRVTPASYVIDSLVSYKGILFDEHDNLVTPAFTVNTDGLLATTEDCTGTLIVEYMATVKLYEYNAQIDTIGGVVIKTGIVWAYDTDLPKNIVTYEIPPGVFKSNEQKRLARVYRELLVADKRYELPSSFTDTDISYASYPDADMAEIDTSTRKDELTQEEILWDGITVQKRDRFNKDWAYPVADPAAGFTDIVWKISTDIPDELAGNTDVTAAVAALQAKYGL